MSQFKCGVWGEPHQEVTAGHTREGHEGEGSQGSEEEVGGSGSGHTGAFVLHGRRGWAQDAQQLLPSSQTLDLEERGGQRGYVTCLRSQLAGDS